MELERLGARLPADLKRELRCILIKKGQSVTDWVVEKARQDVDAERRATGEVSSETLTQPKEPTGQENIRGNVSQGETQNDSGE